MSANPSQRETWFNSYPDSGSLYNVNGHLGGYHAVTTVADGATYYTGSSAARWNGVMVVTHGSAVLHFPGGGSIAASKLTTKEIYNFTVSHITAASSAEIYLLRK